MRNRNKLLSILLASALIGSMLIGCGQQEVVQESSDNKIIQSEKEQSESPEGSDAVELEEATVQMWFISPGKQKDSAKVYEAFNELLQKYVPNTTVEFYTTEASGYSEDFIQMLAAGEEVDLAWVGYAAPLESAMHDGNLMPMNDLLEKYGTGIVDSLSQEVIDMHRYTDNNVYYVPSWQGLLSCRRAFYVPTELVEYVGDAWVEDTQQAVSKWVNDYESIEDLDAVMAQWDKYLGTLKTEGKLYSGLNDYFTGYWIAVNINEWLPSTNNIGVQRNDDSYTVVDAIDTDYFKAYVAYMADFYKKGYWRSDIASINVDDIKFVTNGEYNDMTAVVHCHNAYTDNEVKQRATKAGVDLTAIFMENECTFSNGSKTGMGIPYCADEPERAVMVLNALYTVPELYNMLVYGIEGEHYTVNEDGTITTPYGSSPTVDDNYGTFKWAVGTCLNAYSTQADIPGYYEEIKEKEKTALINPFINFVFDTTNVEAQMSAVNAVDGEYFAALTRGYQGDNWESVYEEFVAERKAAGSEDIVAEYQKQLDAYMEANGIK